MEVGLLASFSEWHRGNWLDRASQAYWLATSRGHFYYAPPQWRGIMLYPTNF